MKKILIIILILSSNMLLAQDDKLPTSGKMISKNDFSNVPDELKANVAEFFATLMEDKISRAYDRLIGDSPIGKKDSEVKALKQQTKRSFALYGNIQGYEPVSSESITSSFIRLRYLGLHTRFPMRWVLTFYKSPELGWVVTNIKFDDLSAYLFSDE